MVKKGLERITKHGVVFNEAEGEVPVDAIVFCTGCGGRQHANYLPPNLDLEEGLSLLRVAL